MHVLWMPLTHPLTTTFTTTFTLAEDRLLLSLTFHECAPHTQSEQKHQKHSRSSVEIIVVFVHNMS